MKALLSLALIPVGVVIALVIAVCLWKVLVWAVGQIAGR